jgi:hypothetical protein
MCLALISPSLSSVHTQSGGASCCRGGEGAGAVREVIAGAPDRLAVLKRSVRGNMASPPPPPPTIAVAFVVTDSEILTSFYMALVAGGVCILVFMWLRGWMGVYQKRMVSNQCDLCGLWVAWHLGIQAHAGSGVVVTVGELSLTAGDCGHGGTA